jgi:hypothetical protein
MEHDVASLFRKLLNSGPRWVRYSAAAALIIGVFLQTVVKSYPDVLARFALITKWEWVVVGLVISFPPAFLWQILKKLMRLPLSNRERAEEYIDIMTLGMREAGLSASDQKFFWRSAMSKLMESFNVGASPPPAIKVLEEIRKADPSAA